MAGTYEPRRVGCGPFELAAHYSDMGGGWFWEISWYHARPGHSPLLSFLREQPMRFHTTQDEAWELGVRELGVQCRVLLDAVLDRVFVKSDGAK